MPAIYPDFDAADRKPPAPSPALGILVCERRETPPFAESSFIRKLEEHGRMQGLPVFAFAPWTWNPADGTVQGWRFAPEEKRWKRESRPLPELVYDRAWPVDDTERSKYRGALKRLDSVRPLAYLNGRLPGKAAVIRLLSRDERIAPYLPPTEGFEGTRSLLRWLDRFGGSAFLKPESGSQGRRVVAIRQRADGSVSLRGRLADNRTFNAASSCAKAAAARIERWIGRRAYIMQPLLDLRNAADEPFDIRALVQKNGRGRWALTGTAVRCGRAGGETANLHGGGRAVRTESVLLPMFGGRHTEQLLREIREICLRVVLKIEQSYGRFAELGLDFGVERTGRIWFLEANSKPGRAAMESAGKDVVRAAAGRPVRYARHILFRPPGRVIHEFDHL